MCMLNIEVIRNLLTQLVSHQVIGNKEAPVLLLGITGAGKSTLGNYLLGYTMQLTTEGEAEPIEKTAPLAMGSGGEAVTLLPQVVRAIDRTLYCDCPGFLDTRSNEIRVCNQVAIELLVNTSSAIAGVILVIDYPSVITSRGAKLIELFNLLNRFFQSAPDSSKSMIYVFTKVPDVVSKAYLLKKLTDMKEWQKKRLTELESTKNIAGKQIGEFQNIMNSIIMLSLMLQREETIHIANIFDHGQSRVDMLRAVRALPPLEKNAFDFHTTDPLREELRSILDTISIEAVTLKKMRGKLPNDIEYLQKQYADLKEELAQKEVFMSEFYGQKAEIRQASVLINEITRVLGNVLNSLNRYNQEKKEKEDAQKQVLARLSILDIDVPYLYWQKEHSVKTSFVKGRDILSVIGRLSEIDPTITDIASGFLFNTKPKEIIFSYNGPPIIRYTKSARGGSFIREDINQKTGELYMVFLSNEENQYANVQVFVEKRLVPEFFSEIQSVKKYLVQLNSEIQFDTEHIDHLLKEKILLELQLEHFKSKKEERQNDDLPRLIREHMIEIRRQLESIYQQKGDKEKQLIEVKEKLKAGESLYQITWQLLALLVNVHSGQSSIAQKEFLQEFTPSSNEQDLSTRDSDRKNQPLLPMIISEADELSAVKEEIRLMRIQMAEMQAQLNELSVLLKSTPAREEETLEQHSPVRLFRSNP